MVETKSIKNELENRIFTLTLRIDSIKSQVAMAKLCVDQNNYLLSILNLIENTANDCDNQ